MPYSFNAASMDEKERNKIDKKNKHYTGFAAMVGRPNVGKSTLTNALIGEKIAIMSDRPQTTRNKIMCILNTDNAQIMFLDTPGIHKPHHKLGQYMVRAAESTLKEVDVILFVVDVSEKRGAGEDYIIEQLKKVKTPVILVANKVDKLEEKSKLFGIIANYVNAYNLPPLCRYPHWRIPILKVWWMKLLNICRKAPRIMTRI